MKIAQRQFENSLSFSHKLNGNHLHLLGSLICMNHRNGHIYVTLLLKANESSERSGDPFTYQLCLMDYHQNEKWELRFARWHKSVNKVVIVFVVF